jgi:hypothetical protein
MQHGVYAALRQLCFKHGFIVDHERTTDIGSILRVPFTHNRKGGKVRPVEIDIECLS